MSPQRQLPPLTTTRAPSAASRRRLPQAVPAQERLSQEVRVQRLRHPVEDRVRAAQQVGVDPVRDQVDLMAAADQVRGQGVVGPVHAAGLDEVAADQDVTGPVSALLTGRPARAGRRSPRPSARSRIGARGASRPAAPTRMRLRGSRRSRSAARIRSPSSSPSASSTAPDSAQSGSVRCPVLVTVATPWASAAMTLPRRPVTPSG